MSDLLKRLQRLSRDLRNKGAYADNNIIVDTISKLRRQQSNITEIIPLDMPDWMREGIDNGDLFRRTIEKVAELERMEVEAQEMLLNQAKTIGQLQANNTDLIKRNGLLRERHDLPVDRIPAHNELIKLQTDKALDSFFISELNGTIEQLQARIEELEKADSDRKEMNAQMLMNAVKSGNRNYLAEIEQLQSRITELESILTDAHGYEICDKCGQVGDLEGHVC